jgi:hypothetical protein
MRLSWRPEYDFSSGVRGKYYQRYQANSNVVVLEPDVSVAFPNAAAVNEALRVLVAIAGNTSVAVAATPVGKAQPNNRTKRTSALPSTKSTRARR